MTQFQFGDRVRIKQKYGYGDGIFLIRGLRKHNDKKVALLVHSKGYFAESVPTEWLELIPHPDTVRLDWIESRSREVSETAVMYDGYNWYSNTNEEYPIELGFPYEAVRQAIDHAMQQEQTK